MTNEVKEEIKQAIIQANKDIDLNDCDYNRGWLGGQLEIAKILENHYGEFIDDGEIMRETAESEEEE